MIRPRDVDARTLCATCRFFVANDIREVPPLPSTTAKFLGFTYERDRWDMIGEVWERNDAIKNNESGWCHRWPKGVKHHHEYWCGEHQPKIEAAA